MPRDHDKDNASGGRRDRSAGRNGCRSAQGGERRFSKRFDKGGVAGQDKRSSRGEHERPFRHRDDEALRRDRDERRPFRFDRDDRRASRERDEVRPTGPSKHRRSGERRDQFDGPERGHAKPWRGRDEGRRGDRGDDKRIGFAHAREARRHDDRPKFGRQRSDRKADREDRESRSRYDPRHERKGSEGRTDWQQARRGGQRFAARAPRDNEDEGRTLAKRPAFGGRGAYRERKEDFDQRSAAEAVRPKKTSERIAKVLARAGLASRREAEQLVVQGRISVNGRVINSPALDVTTNDVISVDGKPLPRRERTRLFLYHKPRGLMTTHADPEGRPTVFDNLPEGLPRLISVGRLDFNTEGLLLLTNDGGLARVLELPETGWLRRYRVRAHGEVAQAQLDQLKDGVEVEGVKYGPIDATLERDQGANVWLVFAIREGKNREVRNVLAHLGLEVNRLIRISFGPFQLGELAEGAVEEVKTRVLREQLGERVIAQAGADFAGPQRLEEGEDDAPCGKKPFKPSGKSALVFDRKGRRVLVQRSGSEQAAEHEAIGGRPRRPKRGYHGKRDLRPRDE
jgi:23S rRNA pseudouridine2605 synthase